MSGGRAMSSRATARDLACGPGGQPRTPNIRSFACWLGMTSLSVRNDSCGRVAFLCGNRQPHVCGAQPHDLTDSEGLMPRVAFDTLPDDARVWVFGAANEIAAPAADRLLQAVDEFLAQWNAHGSPLLCARDWRDDRFLAVGVDQSTAGASGCSIDGLFRTFVRLEPELGTSLVGGSRVYYRDAEGTVQSATRKGFNELARDGRIG